jgi:hypothetical protein
MTKEDKFSSVFGVLTPKLPLAGGEGGGAIPVGTKIIAEEKGSEGENVLGTGEGPNQAGVFQALADDVFAVGSNDAGTSPSRGVATVRPQKLREYRGSRTTSHLKHRASLNCYNVVIVR